MTKKVIKYIGTITYDNNIVFNKFEGTSDQFLDKYLELEQQYKNLIVKEPKELAELREKLYVKLVDAEIDKLKNIAEKSKYETIETINKEVPDFAVFSLTTYNELSDIKTESNSKKSNFNLIQWLKNYLTKYGLLKRQTNK